MPKGRGLVSSRPDGAIFQTRSGRHSYKPLQYWKGEKAVFDDNSTVADPFQKGRFMVLPGIKEIVRVEEEEPAPKKRKAQPAKRAATKAAATSGGAGRRQKQAARAEHDDLEEYEDWEVGAGILTAPVLLWDPLHQTHPPGPDDEVEIVDEQIAVSGPGLEPREIRDADFRFVKTLTLPFLGTGIVDLPIGSEKKSKNSRRMHMVFFVFYGKVSVTVHDFEFNISAGGTFFVPRGQS
jgi:centromere protein C